MQSGVVSARLDRYSPWFSRPCRPPPLKAQAARNVIQVRFEPVDLRIAAVLDDRQAVRTKEAELKLLPDLMIDTRRSR